MSAQTGGVLTPDVGGDHCSWCGVLGQVETVAGVDAAADGDVRE